MPNSNARGQAGAKVVIAVVLAVVAVNALLSPAPLSDLGLPSISLPDIPGWVHTVLKAKNWIVLAIVGFIVIGHTLDQLGEGRKRAGGDEGERGR
jgi:hypothetical protein